MTPIPMSEEKKTTSTTDQKSSESVASSEEQNSKMDADQLDQTIAHEPVPTDPFLRLQKKQVAKPKPLQSSDGISKQVKKGSKISPKIFLAGCGFFFMIFLALVFVGLYYALTSTEYLQSLGLEVESVKNILIIFASLFFGLIFFVGFYMLVLNVYRVATVKGKKFKYVIGIILGFLVIALTIVFGTLSIMRIRSIVGSSKIQTNQLALPYVVTKGGDLVWVNNGIPVIAPLKVKYQLNKDQFDRNILSRLGTNQISSFILDCGNGYQLAGTRQMYLNGTFFPDHCLYLEKGTYPIALTVEYPNRQTGDPQSQTFRLYDLRVAAEIKLDAIDDKPYLNDEGTELILGVAPVDMQVRGQLLFTDLGLNQDRIEWDLDNDSQVDVTNNASFAHTLAASQLHTINYRLPELPGGFGQTWFTFDLRVVESELARCTIDIKKVSDKTFTFTPQFDEQVTISQYKYLLSDAILDTQLDKIDTNKNTATYTFAKGGTYMIDMMYFTPQQQKGSCDTKELVVGFDGNQVVFDLKYRQDSTLPFISVDTDTEVQRDDINNEINVTILPAVLEIAITDIFPDPNAQLAVYYDGKQVFEERDSVYEINIATLGEKQLEFVVTTVEGKESTQAYQVNVSRGSVVADLKVDPIVGEDPLTVSLDASISNLYDEDDEIVYFNWDFDDGEILTNVSQGKVDHIYRYDTDAERGEFYPTVTVKTRKGFEDTIRLKEPIIVKKKQRVVTVRADSHPTQQARIGDNIDFSLTTDGVVKRIDWNFGDFSTVGCDNRLCTSVTNVYEEAGEYEVTVEVQFENESPVVGRMKLRVY